METEQFVRRFFGEGNRFNYADIQKETGGTYEAIHQWVTSLIEQGEPVVLPRWVKDKVVWYGLAHNERQAQRLVEEVKAFVGPSYSTFTGGRASLNMKDPVERAVADFTGGQAIKFSGDNDEIRDALNLMHDVRERREPYQTEEDLGVGLVLRRFNMALRAGDRAAAEEHLGYLRERNLLDTDNLSYLTVRMLGEFEAWEELLQRDEIPDLIQQEGRPLSVNQALIQAIYNVHLASFEKEDDPEGAVEHFASTVLPEYGDLFAVRSSMQAPEVLKAFMMRAVTEDGSDSHLRADLLEAAENTGLNDPFFDALAALGEEKAPGQQAVKNPMASAMNAWTEGRFDKAFQLLCEAGPSVQKARLLIPLVDALQSLDVESELSETLTQLDGPERQKLVQKNSMCRRLAESAGPPSNWAAWFESVKEGRYASVEQALTYAEKLAEEWHPKQLLDASGALEWLTKSIENAPLGGEAGRTVSRALPSMLGALQNDPKYPRSTFQGLYQAVQTRIPYVDDLTKSDLDVYLDLSEIRLEYGVSVEQYREIINGAMVLWNMGESARRIDWLLDFAELLVLTSTRDEEVQMRFLTMVVGAIRKYEKHVEPVQIELFRSLCDEIGHPEVAANLEIETDESEAEVRDPLREVLDGQTLGIYTLTESAGRRVKKFLKERCPDLTVHLRHDKAGSPELHRVAERADYFLVVTRSATHAATDVIEQHVPTERLIRPQGKGESSMLRDLATYVENILL